MISETNNYFCDAIHLVSKMSQLLTVIENSNFEIVFCCPALQQIVDTDVREHCCHLVNVIYLFCCFTMLFITQLIVQSSKAVGAMSFPLVTHPSVIVGIDVA